jgi:radical SAM superfamily enzyme YgiQ (UPF0313 family)
MSRAKIFHFVMIKPSHYDDDGYVIQWRVSSIPSNSMAALYGIALHAIEHRPLGPDVEIRLEAYDETNTRIVPEAITGRLSGPDSRVLIALVGVQSNQFPRAIDLARRFRAAGVHVCIGGFHVSGCVSMLPELPQELLDAQAEGISLFAGEIEGRIASLWHDAWNAKLRPLYDYMDDLPGLEGQPVPWLPLEVIGRISGSRASFDAGRGCPFKCSFCTIINVQGRKSRTRTVEDVEQIIRRNHAQGIYNYFISDDNFARNRMWEPIFDLLIRLKEEEGLQIYVVLQVDTQCHKIKRFIDKAGRAGVNRVFIGMENINPEALQGAQKRQNKISEYRSMLQAWHAVGAMTYAGYIIGFPNDTPESLVRDIGIIQRELPIDILEFFILTPLPGSQDHKELWEKGVPMASDLNLYDTFHVTTAHATMSDDQLQAAYQRAWDTYYTLDHLETVLHRAKVRGYDLWNMVMKMISFYVPPKLERVHPLDGGIWRRKYRRDRRPGLPIESPLVFHAKFWTDVAVKYTRFAWLLFGYWRVYRRVLKADSHARKDVALERDSDLDLSALDLVTERAPRLKPAAASVRVDPPRPLPLAQP